MEDPLQVKKKKSIFDQRSLFFSVAILILFGVLVTLILRISAPGQPLSQMGLTGEQIRELANRLKADGLVEQAMRAYEEYLEKGRVKGEDRAPIYYSIGEMLLNADRYEDALSYFYKAEIANPDTELKTEIGARIVTCLERLGKELDAESELEARANLEGEERVKKRSGDVVAKIGIREITMGEINEQMEKLPPWIKNEYAQDEARKLEFVEQYVARELLYDKGVKLGFHRDPEIRQQVKEASKQLIIEKVITQEITEKIQIDPVDLENFYTANRDQYREPAQVKFRHILVATEEKAREIVANLEKGANFEELAKAESKDEASKERGGLVEGWISEARLDYEQGFIDQLLKMEVNGSPTVISSEQGFHVVQVVDRKEAQDKTFEEVREQAAYDYRAEKQLRLSQELLMKLVKSKDVEIYNAKFIPEETEEENNNQEEK